MSAQRRTSSSASAESNQFIRPNKTLTCVNTASAAKRLALKSAGFATSEEVAAAIRGGVAPELADDVMAALGNCFERLSDEDVSILADLYTAAPGAATTTADAIVEPEGPNILAERESDQPHSPVEAGGDAAAGSPTPSITAAPGEKGAISSSEDDSSADQSPSGDGHTVLVELPVNNSLPKWRMIGRCAKSKMRDGQPLASLTRRLTGISFSL
jgi:hypothetical protein